MRGWRLYCLLVFAPSAVQAEAGGFVLVRAVDVEGAARDSTGDGLLDFGRVSTEGAVLLEGSSGGFEWRLRGSVAGSVDEFPGTARGQVNALSYSFQPTESLFVAVGKQELLWGAGQSYQPIGFLRTQTNLRDPLDTEGRSQGLPLLRVTRLAVPVTLDAIYAHGVGRYSFGQTILKASGQLGKIDATALLRHRDGSGIGIGASATWAGTAFQAYADAYYGEPERRPTVDDPTGGALPDRATVSRRQSSTKRVSLVAGATWTPSSTVAVTFEYARRGEGLRPEEWSQLLDRVLTAASELREGRARVNLPVLAGAATILAGSPVRRDYLFSRVSVSAGTLTMSGNVNVGISDGSASVTAIAAAPIASRFFLNLTATTFIGTRRSEFGQNPLGSVFSIALRRTFDL